MPPALADLPPAVWLAAAYAAITLGALALFAFDKRAAARGAPPARRIRERTLHFWTFVGGGLGALAGLFWLRHKTRHASFWLRAFAALVGHGALWCWRSV